VVDIRDASGNLLNPNATYRVAVNSFLASARAADRALLK
jgi:hypothetical protein